MRRAAFAILAGVVVLMWAHSASAQCAMCVTALQNSADGKGLAESFGNGILFLLAVPYVVLGAVVWSVYRAYRKQSQQSHPDFATTEPDSRPRGV